MTDDAGGLVGAVVGVLVLAGAIRLLWPNRDNLPARLAARRWLYRVLVGGLIVLGALVLLRSGSG